MTEQYHDFRPDTFGAVDGRHYVWAAIDPATKFEVVSLLDFGGDETDDPDLAAGGVVKFDESSFSVFTF